ncbi:TPA: acetyl-CoA carboxylase carboxyltransferase subunit alpha [Candidatus Poribacteria bacterium]|nr:acetyl-CoA carboxylase carboxyltransferase subunit alpha [Candidatus Poribacteria bacterium]
MRASGLDFEKSIIELETIIDNLKTFADSSEFDLARSITSLEKDLESIKKRVFQNLTRWNIVSLARHEERPQAVDYINALLEDNMELHGDGLLGDDPALSGGIGWFDGQPVVYLGQQKGKSAKERISRNFGMMHPEGYRKGRRLMKLAEKFDRPIISFVDTSGAHPGKEAEQHGQAMAIAENLALMAQLRVPLVAIIIGEGGSGGALGIALADRVLMLQYAMYCVCPPEACSGILWRDHGEHAPEAAEGLKLIADDLLAFGIIDEVIKEPLGGAHCNPKLMFLRVRRALKRHLSELMRMDKNELLEKRYQRYRRIGVYGEGTVE